MLPYYEQHSIKRNGLGKLGAAAALAALKPSFEVFQCVKDMPSTIGCGLTIEHRLLRLGFTAFPSLSHLLGIATSTAGPMVFCTRYRLHAHKLQTSLL